jgi:transposase-like protein
LAATVSRLKEVWYQEYEQWRTAGLEASQYAYTWADGVYFNARVEGERRSPLITFATAAATSIGRQFNAANTTGRH